MSTRSNIHFTYQGVIYSNIYRQYDGYPSGMLPDLEKFLQDVEKDTPDTRFTDPSYLAAKFVVWQANEYRKSYDGKTSPLLDFLGIGIVLKDVSDGEYLYEVDCGNLDSQGRPSIRWRSVENPTWNVGFSEEDEE